jgi:hypothetical protein
MSDRAIIGPLFTASGFQSWLLVCQPNKIVAVPMGFWFALTTNKAATLFVGGAIGGGMAKGGESSHQKKAEHLHQMPDNELADIKGIITYPTDELSAIVYKCKRLSSSEFIFVKHDGTKKLFGIMNASEEQEIVAELSRRYGELVVEK